MFWNWERALILDVACSFFVLIRILSRIRLRETVPWAIEVPMITALVLCGIWISTSQSETAIALGVVTAGASQFAILFHKPVSQHIHIACIWLIFIGGILCLLGFSVQVLRELEWSADWLMGFGSALLFPGLSWALVDIGKQAVKAISDE